MNTALQKSAHGVNYTINADLSIFFSKIREEKFKNASF